MKPNEQNQEREHNMFEGFKKITVAVVMGTAALMMSVAAEAAPINKTSFGVAGGFNPAPGTDLGNTNSIVVANGGAVTVTSGDPYDLTALVNYGGTGVLKDISSLSPFTPIMSYLTLSTGVSLDLLSLTINGRSGGPPGFLNLSGQGVLHAPGFDATQGLFSWTGTTTDNLTFSFAVQTSTVPEPISLALLGLGLTGIAIAQVLVVHPVDDQFFGQHRDFAQAGNAVRKIEILGAFHFLAQVTAQLLHRVGPEHHRGMADRVAVVEHPIQHRRIGAWRVAPRGHPPVFQERHLRAHHYRLRMEVEKGFLLGEAGGMGEIVSVEDGESAPAGHCSGRIAGGDHALVPGLLEQADARVGQACDHVAGAVGGTVVDHDQFEVWIALGEHALDAFQNEALRVVRGHDDADVDPTMHDAVRSP